MRKFIKFLSLTLLVAMVLSTGVEAAEEGLKRLSGENRVHTSIEISKEAYERAENVILVGYTGEVDALTGSVLATAKDAPVLFVNERYLKDVKKRLLELETKNVYILGGEGVFSKKLYNEFKDYNPTRIKGDNRYHTAVEVAKSAVGQSADEVFLALGIGNYADALAVGSISAKSQKPLLLAGKGVLPQETKDALKDMKVKKVNIVGGVNAIPQKLVKELEALKIETVRTSGNSREETAIELAKKFNPNHSSVVIANGWKYADAVVGGYFAAMKDAPMLLAKEDDMKDELTNYLAKGIQQAYILGGSAVVDDYVYDLIKWSLDGQVDKKPEKGISQKLYYSKTIQPEFDQVRKFSEDLAAVYKNGKWGYIDEAGQTVIDFKYDAAYSFSEGKALVGELKDPKDLDDWAYVKLGFIDKDNNYTPLTYEDDEFRTDINFYNAYVFHKPEGGDKTYYNGFIRLSVDGPEDYIFDKNGVLHWLDAGEDNWIIPWNHPTEDTWPVFMMNPDPYNAKMNYYDMKTGKLLFKNPKFELAFPFNQGLALVSFTDSKGEEYWSFIDKKGKLLDGAKYYGHYAQGINTHYKIFNDYSLASLKDKKGKWGAVRKDGKLIIPFKYQALGTFTDGLAFFMENNKYGFIDADDKKVIKAQFDRVSSFDKGLALAIQKDQTLLIDKEGKRVLGDSSLSEKHYFTKDANDNDIVYSPGEYLVIKEKSKFGFAKVKEK